MEHAILNETIDGQKIDFYPETGFEDVVDLDNNNKTLKTVVGELQDADTAHNASTTAHPNGLAFPLMTWTAGTAYAVNAVVVYDKKIYQCITANSDSTFTKAKWNNIGGGDGVPVGAVVPFSGNGDYPTGYLLCNGASVSRTMYPDLFSVIGTTFGAVDDTHFNLPDLRDKFVEGAETAGTNKSAGLPNITGTVRSGDGTSTASAVFPLTEGAFEKDTITENAYTADTGKATNYWGFKFDASKSNSIYGNSTTVQPPALTMRYVIKAFDGQTADSALVDVTQYANELTDIRAKYLPLSGGAMSGSILKNVDNDRLIVCGGSVAGNGAYLMLSGKDRATVEGVFVLSAKTTGAESSLQGTPTGLLTWAGNEVERVVALGDGYVRYASGLQMCWGGGNNISNISTGKNRFTYPAAFISDPSVSIFSIFSSADVFFYKTSLAFVGTSNFMFYAFGYDDNLTGDMFAVSWIAIGRWK